MQELIHALPNIFAASESEIVLAVLALVGNRPLEPKVWEVEFFPIEEVLYEEIEI